MQLPAETFEIVLLRWTKMLRSQHASIVDALSGKRLDVREQCVPIEVAQSGSGAASTGFDSASAAGVASASGAASASAATARVPADTVDEQALWRRSQAGVAPLKKRK